MLTKCNLETLVFLGKFILCYFKTLLLREQWYRQTTGSWKFQESGLGSYSGPTTCWLVTLGLFSYPKMKLTVVPTS